MSYIDRETIPWPQSADPTVADEQHGYDAGFVVGYNTALCKMKTRIANVPAADVKPVIRGEWIQYGTMKWYCSKCGRTIEREECSLPNFCEDCGANMKPISQD